MWAALCSAAALATGVFPLLRNFLWTGDPFFPFLTRWMGRVPVNEFGLESLQTGRPLERVFHAAVSYFVFPGCDDRKRRGLWLGTLFWPHRSGLSAAADLLQLESRGSSGWPPRCAAACSSPMRSRRKQPDTCSPLILSLSHWLFSERPWLPVKEGAYVRFGCAATLAVFGLFCLASDTFMQRIFCPSRWAWKARSHFSTGWRLTIKPRMFVNSAMAQRKGKALIFFRHSIIASSLRERGSPLHPGSMNPAVLTDPQTLLAFLKEQDIRWVVKSPDYPEALASVFEECEKEGLLVPEARTDI